jgi:SAM-dependent methyltransferase
MSADLRRLVAGLNASAGALAVLGAVIDARLSGTPLDPRLAPYATEVVNALGASAALEAASDTELRAAMAPIRAFALMNAKLLSASGRVPGWRHAEGDILQSLGGMTHGLAGALRGDISSLLDGLGSRLQAPDAAFLDVGVGVARLSLEIAQAFPQLRIVGVDPWAPAIALARQNVSTAGLADRIELRAIGGEQLTDESAFDLAWIASAFMPPAIVPAVVAAVRRALKPGGWALLALSRPRSGDPIADPLWDFWIASFGGAAMTSTEGCALLRHAGYTEARTLPTPPGAVTALVAGRR